MILEKSKIYALISSLLFMLLVFLLLWFVYMPALQRPQPDEGIMVSFGDGFDGSGWGEMLAGEEDYEPEESGGPSVPASNQELMTQEGSKSLAVPKTQTSTNKNQKPAIDPLQQQREQQRQREQAAAEAKRRAEAQAAAEAKKRAEAAARSESLIGGAFGSGGTGSGTTTGDSRQGNPAGKGSSGGHGWSLAGRSLVGSLATPAYPSNVEGKVTVSIRVDASGNVTSVSVGSPTDISDTQTRNAALSAARQTRFTSGTGVSSGTITYNFRMK